MFLEGFLFQAEKQKQRLITMKYLEQIRGFNMFSDVLWIDGIIHLLESSDRSS